MTPGRDPNECIRTKEASTCKMRRPWHHMEMLLLGISKSSGHPAHGEVFHLLCKPSSLGEAPAACEKLGAPDSRNSITRCEAEEQLRSLLKDQAGPTQGVIK